MHANLKILRKVRNFLRGRTTARPHVSKSLNTHCTPCAIQPAHLAQYTQPTCTIHTQYLV